MIVVGMTTWTTVRETAGVYRDQGMRQNQKPCHGPKPRKDNCETPKATTVYEDGEANRCNTRDISCLFVLLKDTAGYRGQAGRDFGARGQAKREPGIIEGRIPCRRALSNMLSLWRKRRAEMARETACAKQKLKAKLQRSCSPDMPNVGFVCHVCSVYVFGKFPCQG